jgi:hypothetical protein
MMTDMDLLPAPTESVRQSWGKSIGAVAGIGAAGCDALVATGVTPAGVWR